MTHIPLCQTPGCPHPTEEEWHRCFVCAKQPIQHQHWPKLSQAGKSSRIVAALCPNHTDKIDNGLWTNGVHQQGGKWYYWVLDEKGQTVQLWTPEGKVDQREITDPQFPGSLPVKRIPTDESEFPPPDEPREAKDTDTSQEMKVTLPAAKQDALVQYDATCLRLPENMPYEKWVELGGTLQAMGKGLQWWLGDWLSFGERKFGEKYTQAVEETGVDRGILANYAWVSSNVDPSLRNDKLKWSHHRMVADLEPDLQREWLQRAQDENLTANNLRAMIKGEEPDTCPESATGRHEYACKHCGRTK